MVVAIAPTALPVLTDALAVHAAATVAWRANGVPGERPRLVLPLDRPHPTWRGFTAAQAAYRAALQRVEAYLETLDCFDKPSLARPDIQRADRAIQAAFRAHDYGAVVAALARWEQSICGAAAMEDARTRQIFQTVAGVDPIIVRDAV